MGITNNTNKILKAFADHRDVTADAAARKKFALNDGARLAEREYYICFTPRSGSSWLTDLLQKTKVMGNPGEWFNPDLLANNLKRGYPCANLREYIDYIRTRWASDNVFGCEMTWLHYNVLREALATDRIQDRIDLRHHKVVYLWRNDLVAQAVSLHRAISTRKFHSTQHDGSDGSDDKIPYPGEEIWKWMMHILQQEYGWRRYFRDHAISYLSLSYEELCNSTALTISRICQYVRGSERLSPTIEVSSGHAKMASDRSTSVAIDFYSRNAAKVEHCLEHRGSQDSAWFRRTIHLDSNR